MIWTSSQRQQTIISSTKHDLKCQSFSSLLTAVFQSPLVIDFKETALYSFYICMTYGVMNAIFCHALHLWDIDFNNKVIDKGCIFENHTFNHVLMATSLSNSVSHFLFTQLGSNFFSLAYKKIQLIFYLTDYAGAEAYRKYQSKYCTNNKSSNNI